MPRVLIGSIAEMRVTISRAALLVKVTARTPLGLTFPVWISQAIRVVRTRVFPEPAPARISAYWSGRVTAASCSGLRFSSRLSMRAFENAGFYRSVESETEYPTRPAADSRGYNRFFSKPVHAAPVRPEDHRAKSARALGPDRGIQRQGRRAGREILLPVDVSLPLGQAAYGARAQLHHRRRDDPLSSNAGFQRAPADGLGRLRSARRKRRDGKRRAAGEVDLRQHRRNEAPAALARLRARLGARARHLLT